MALPGTLDSTSPAGSDNVSDGDNNIRAFKLYIVDVFGVPDGTAVSGAAFAITDTGAVSFVATTVDFADNTAFRDSQDNNVLDISDAALGVDVAATFSSTLEVTGAVDTGSTLDVTGATTLDSTLDVTGASELTGAVDTGSTLDVTGATTLDSTLAVTGTSALTGAVDTGSTLDVTGDATFDADVTATDGVTIINAAPATPVGGTLYEDNIVKAWVKWTYSGGTPNVDDDFNVSSLTDTGTGQVGVNLAQNMSNTSYGSAGAGNESNINILVDTHAVGSFNVTVQAGSTGTNSDGDGSVLIIGNG